MLPEVLTLFCIQLFGAQITQQVFLPRYSTHILWASSRLRTGFHGIQNNWELFCCEAKAAKTAKTSALCWIRNRPCFACFDEASLELWKFSKRLAEYSPWPSPRPGLGAAIHPKSIAFIENKYISHIDIIRPHFLFTSPYITSHHFPYFMRPGHSASCSSSFPPIYFGTRTPARTSVASGYIRHESNFKPFAPIIPAQLGRDSHSFVPPT